MTVPVGLAGERYLRFGGRWVGAGCTGGMYDQHSSLVLQGCAWSLEHQGQAHTWHANSRPLPAEGSAASTALHLRGEGHWWPSLVIAPCCLHESKGSLESEDAWAPASHHVIQHTANARDYHSLPLHSLVLSRTELILAGGRAIRGERGILYTTAARLFSNEAGSAL